MRAEATGDFISNNMLKWTQGLRFNFGKSGKYMVVQGVRCKCIAFAALRHLA
jgi:hypothetical protein